MTLSLPTKRINYTPYVTTSFISLGYILPPNLDLDFVSTGVDSNLQPITSLLRSLGLNAKTKGVGMFDIDILAKETVLLLVFPILQFCEAWKT
jgi:hypothetical protein